MCGETESNGWSLVVKKPQILIGKLSDIDLSKILAARYTIAVESDSK